MVSKILRYAWLEDSGCINPDTIVRDVSGDWEVLPE